MLIRLNIKLNTFDHMLYLMTGVSIYLRIPVVASIFFESICIIPLYFLTLLAIIIKKSFIDFFAMLLYLCRIAKKRHRNDAFSISFINIIVWNNVDDDDDIFYKFDCLFWRRADGARGECVPPPTPRSRRVRREVAAGGGWSL